MAADPEGITPVPGIENLTYEDVNTILNIQRLWMKLVESIRNFFHSALANLPDQSAVGNQLFVRLPSEIASEFRKYYSEAESRQFLSIISRMIASNWQLATAYKSKDKTAIDLRTAQLYQTADELAAFFAGVNKYLDEAKLKTMPHEYVNLRIKEIIALLDGNYDAEIKIYEEIDDIVTRLSYYTAMGIVAQRHAASIQVLPSWSRRHRYSKSYTT